MTETATPTATTAPDTEFALLDVTGPAVVADRRLTPGDTLTHDEYGPLELVGYGWSNGALGDYVKLASVADFDAPAKWSLEAGGPNSLVDAYRDGRLSIGGEQRG